MKREIKFNNKLIVSIELKDKQINGDYQYHKKHKRGFFRLGPVIDEGIYYYLDYYDKHPKPIDIEYLPDSLMVKGRDVYIKPRMVIEYVNGYKHIIFYDSIELAKIAYDNRCSLID